MSDESLVELDSVRKEFGDVTAVDRVDFSVRRGEFFSLVGPSGCGKTTTLRMISGFETPTKGDVRIDGRSMVDVPPEARDTNLVFQHLSLFPHMTVGENVGYGLKKAGVDAGERSERVRNFLELVDLEGFADRDPTEISGGQQQRVAIARALVNEPKVLLLDEPLSALDRKLRKQMQVELRKIHEKVQGAFFYVTHDQEVAMTLSDRVAVMNNGRIEQIGTPEEIYRNPATSFVADFIGDTNMLHGEAQRRNGSCVVELGGENGMVLEADTEVNGAVDVSIRPEDLIVADDGDISGTVVERYFQGDQTNYVIESANDLPPLSVVTQGRRGNIERGDELRVDVRPGAPVVFEA
ncbi:spermidine/putrescine ABC transporter ATPase component [Halogeometricum borinquense DSM 11551]|uniref:Molybdate/tungstate import ATP-binding protein WtpC n=2 Tax=Halogeometricum borinquense TaxID=60847 RepID=E4NLK1_HALBP|nr:ABC transporter ATP-binding protein [Halogeometricum borinquense]ADQ67204.1 ABC-type spermidine/putrescine transport system, ATPase component [Halogeometricum borinquense DSM 11551]ELY29751.1 spermidine/putrescine ABC transporter ATPase component [Halogeometricum borinquense DSM 11551]RYJ13843.1 ABC transporter ATP-binding protein [Halogeometricum borinquense]